MTDIATTPGRAGVKNRTPITWYSWPSLLCFLPNIPLPLPPSFFAVIGLLDGWRARRMHSPTASTLARCHLCYRPAMDDNSFPYVISHFYPHPLYTCACRTRIVRDGGDRLMPPRQRI